MGCDHLAMQQLGGIAQVCHQEDEIRLCDLGKGSMESLDEKVRQIVDEAHRVRKQDPAAFDLQGPRSWRESGKGLILSLNSRTGEGIEQSALAGVGVACKSYKIETLFSSLLPSVLAHCLHVFQFRFYLGHPSTDVVVHRLLVSTGATKARLLTARLQGELTANLRRIITEPGQINLQLGLARGRTGGKYLQNKIESIENLRRKLASYVKDLTRAKRIVKYQFCWMVTLSLGDLSHSYLEAVVPFPTLFDLR